MGHNRKPEGVDADHERQKQVATGWPRNALLKSLNSDDNAYPGYGP